MIRIIVTFSIRSSVLRPDKITEILGIAPEYEVVRGADWDPPRSHPPKHGWTLRIERDSECDIAEDISTLISRIDGTHQFPQLKILDPEIETVVYVTVAPKTHGMWLHIEQDLLREMTKFDCSFDVEYFAL